MLLDILLPLSSFKIALEDPKAIPRCDPLPPYRVTLYDGLGGAPTALWANSLVYYPILGEVWITPTLVDDAGNNVRVFCDGF